MKLRNKKTGEIIETDYMFGVSVPTTETFGCKSYDQIAAYSSLAELNEEWEDYEEPKQYWFIATDGRVLECNEYANEDACWNGEKAIGNFFETREEAEKAVEKLKAWKRLKDKGIEFYGWRKKHTGTYDFLARWKEVPPKMHDIIDDLDLLFGGEE